MIELINNTFSIGTFFVNEVNYRLRDKGISYQQAVFLLFLQASGGCKPSRLAEVFQYQTQSVTTILNRMDDNGLIRREVDPFNRRFKIVKLTEKGEDLANQVSEVLDWTVLDLGLDNLGLDLGNIRELWQVAELFSYRRPTGTGARKPKQAGEFGRVRREYLREKGLL